MIMPFEFTQGPYSTHMTREQIANAVKEVGREQRFVGVMNWMLNKPKPEPQPNHHYGAFAPGDDDECFSSTAARQADWRIGWRREYSVLTQGGRRDRGWRVIFEVFDDGPARNVLARVHGESERKEVERFVEHVFDLLWWDQSDLGSGGGT